MRAGVQAALLALALPLLCPAVLAEDDAPLTPEQAADVVVEAALAGADEEVASLAVKDQPDPWMVAEALCVRGEREAAAAFASAATRPDTAPLAAYVARRSKQTESDAVFTALDAVQKQLAAREPEKVLEAAASVSPPLTSVSAIRVVGGRGMAFQDLGRRAEAIAAYLDAAEGARSIGWRAMAVQLYWSAARIAWQVSDFRESRAAYAQMRALQLERGKATLAARARVDLGYCEYRLGNLDAAQEHHEKALARLEADDHKEGVCAALVGLSNVHASRGELRESIGLLERSLKIREGLGDHRGSTTALLNLGSRYVQVGDVQKGLEAQRQALALATEHGQRFIMAVARAQIGATYYELGEYAKAAEHIESGLVALRELGDRLGVAIALGNLATLYLDQGDYEKALVAHRTSLEMREAIGDREGMAHAYGGIGNVHFARGAYANALPWYERMLDAAEGVGNRVTVARALRNIADVRTMQGDSDGALGLYDRALALFELVGEPKGVSDVLRRVAGVHLERGDLRAARNILDRLLPSLGALPEASRRRAAGERVIGLFFSEMGQFEEAVDHLERALKTTERMGNRNGSALVLGSLGLVHKDMGDTRQARSFYERALEVHEQTGSRTAAASTIFNLAGLHLDRGDVGRAQSMYQRALRIHEATGAKLSAARCHACLGSVHTAMGRFAPAIASAEQALAAFEVLGSTADVANSHVKLSTIYLRLGEYDRALAHAQRALEIREAGGAATAIVDALATLGTIHASAGNLDAALEYARKTLDRAEQMGLRRAIDTAHATIAEIHVRRGEAALAIEHFEKALEGMESAGERPRAALVLGALGVAHANLGNEERALSFLDRGVRAARSLRDRTALAANLGRLATVRLQAGQNARALFAAQKGVRELEGLLGGLAEEEATTARALYASIFDAGTLAAARLGEPQEVVTFLDSGRAGALLEMLGSDRAFRFAALPEELSRAEEEASVRVTKARRAHTRARESGDPRETRAAARAMDDVVEVQREVAARIQREAKRQAGLLYPRAAVLEEIQGWLEDDQALVLYGLCLGEALALVVTLDDARVVDLGPAVRVERACLNAQPLLAPDRSRGPLHAEESSGASSDVDSARERLRALLVSPLQLEDAVRTVLVSPVGPLSYVPFGALFGQRAVAMTPSGTTHVLLMEEERERGEGVLAVGDPSYEATVEPIAGGAVALRSGATLGPLPATREEAMAVGDVVLLGDDANEVALREAIGKRARWRAVHLACHGLVDPERPTLSALALVPSGDEDGFLTALEVLRMEIPADLAVLSACETGTGKIVKGEGIVGLTRAFMYAGAPRVLCSLWKVDDDATRALMEKFYELWSPDDGEGLPAAEALRQAQAFVRGHEKWAHPYYWAAWALWGLPR